VRYSEDSDDLLIFLGGDGICFNSVTCPLTPTGANRKSPNAKGIFNFSREDNPVKDYNAIYVPYCTGDAHLGSRPNGHVPYVDGVQRFVGGDNYRLFLASISKTFTKAQKVVLAGSGAGGFGAALNYYDTALAFGDDTQVVFIDDAGPLMRAPYLAACLQQELREMWDIDEFVPHDCIDCFQKNGSGFHHMFKYMKKHLPNISGGLISSFQDSVIRLFFGFGNNNCETPVHVYSGSVYARGLEDLRKYTDNFGSFGNYFYLGQSHSILTSPSFYMQTVNGTPLIDWFTGILDGVVSQIEP
jgi:hypothetical protein